MPISQPFFLRLRERGFCLRRFRYSSIFSGDRVLQSILGRKTLESFVPFLGRQFLEMLYDVLAAKIFHCIRHGHTLAPITLE